METWLWVTYLSGEAWILGWVVMLPVGGVIYSWLALEGMITFFDIFADPPVGDFGQWFMGPFWRGWVSGPFIFLSNVILTIIPGLNFLTAFLFGWWAIADYYGYNYELGEGPTLPAPAA